VPAMTMELAAGEAEEAAKMLRTYVVQPKMLGPGGNGNGTMKAIDPRMEAEQRMTEALARVLSKLGNQYADAIRRGEMVPDDVLREALERTIEVELTEIAATEGRRIGQQVGVQFDPASTVSAASQWARGYSYELVSGLTDTTRKLTQRAVEKFISTPGMTRRELEDLLSPAFGRVRAEAIAVTETTRAVSAATNQYQQQLEEAGISMERIWQTRNDELVCPI